MLCPVHWAIKPELIFKLAFDGDDTLAVNHAERAGKHFLYDRKLCSHGDEGAFVFPARFDCREHPRVSLTMHGQSSGCFFGGNRTKPVDTNEESSAAVISGRPTQLPRHAHGIPQRVELFWVILEYKTGERAAFHHQRQLQTIIGKSDGRRSFKGHILRRSVISPRRCEYEKNISFWRTHAGEDTKIG